MSPVGSVGPNMSVQQIMALRSQIIDRSNTLQGVHAPEAAGASRQLSSPVSPAQGFENTLRGMLDSVNAAQTKADTVSTAYQMGEETDVAKVMLARQESSVAFEATLQVRNKLLSAYQEIMRMGV